MSDEARPASASIEIRVVCGVPTDEELAAIVSVLLLARTPVVSPPTRSRWATSARPPATDRDAGWRASGLPRR